MCVGPKEGRPHSPGVLFDGSGQGSEIFEVSWNEIYEGARGLVAISGGCDWIHSQEE